MGLDEMESGRGRSYVPFYRYGGRATRERTRRRICANYYLWQQEYESYLRIYFAG